MFEIRELTGKAKRNLEEIFDDVKFKLGKLNNNTKKEIRRALFDIGRDMKKDALELIDSPKTGRTYRIRIGGQIVEHIASAPGEAPAIITGRLRRSIRYKVIGGNMLEFASYDTPYAKYLEYADLINESGQGSKNIEPRPFLSAAFKKNSAYFAQKLKGALVKASML